MNISIAIIEDEISILENFQHILNNVEGFTCKHVFSNAEDAINTLPFLKIDVVLTDIHLPGKSGIECIQQLKYKCPNTNFIICTSFDESETIFSALKAGASGYILKSTSPQKLIDAIIESAQGGSPINSHIARKIINTFSNTTKNIELEKLSTREKEILDLLSLGYRYKEMASQLNLSTDTIRTHVRNIYGKLQVNSRTDALNKVYNKV